MTTGYPAILVLDGRLGVVIGGGQIGGRKVQTLLDAGAKVKLIATDVTPALRAVGEVGSIEIAEREYVAGDLAGAAVVIAATNDAAVNKAVYDEATAAGIPVNVVDDMEHCTFIAPSIIRRGDLMIAISTGGRGPALAVRLREKLEREIGEEYGQRLRLLGELRDEVLVPGDQDERRDRWYRVVDSIEVTELICAGRYDEALSKGRALLTSDPETLVGIVTLVGAGPGDAGLITVRGLLALRSADVIVYDRLVSPELLAFAREDAERIYAGKDSRGNGMPQNEVNATLIRLAGEGKRVVRLKGGDPFVFGRGGEEVEALAEAGVAYEVVPGVTSAIAGPAAAGIPVTHRDAAASFAVVTAQGAVDGAGSRIDWEALARIDTVIVMMGVARLEDVARSLIDAGRAPDTPVAVISDATLPTQQMVTATLEKIAAVVFEAGIQAPAITIVGDVIRFALRGSTRVRTE